MSESNSLPPPSTGPGKDLAEQSPHVGDDQRNDGDRKAFNAVIGSLLRICTTAQHMLGRDERWHMRKNPSANEVMDVVFDSMRECEQEYRRWRDAPLEKGARNSPHPLGAVAELLAAKTLATFGSDEAVNDLTKWTRKAESKFTGPSSL